ncbi:hypothetical protein S40285_08537 [Stachybotrys chlorohalonatus IBT 40285]|uniref:Heterokaryon incompatibility domain-containing protein n=1 Tax=Stachybotrys chlorohalonatus (strain IBT 40285) TaxID=1283841 RepID=A0A084QBG4_STAC4|nr:hypothetical protein S40285_08537 [Stachybotrys chlorohalonata IBT 40285]
MAHVASPSTSHDHHCWEKVIEDSITVTKTLGLDYLWVNRICINESDDNKTLHQIRQMDQIYATAALTIIAAAGSGPDHGLPGVNGTLRVPQGDFIFPNIRLVSTLPKGDHTIRSSKWSTRGWTYQESLLSTRRLIFTETQVFFECNGMHCSEVMRLPLDDMHDSRKIKFDMFAYEKGALQAKAPGLDPHKYMKFFHQYCFRELSHPTDRLNAFQGIINSFKRAKRPVYTFWGLPIFIKESDLSRWSAQMKLTRSRTARFLTSFFWQFYNSSKGVISRNGMDFPSWSWVGWNGSVSSFLPVCSKNGCCFSDARVWLQKPCKTTIDFEVVELSPRMSAVEDLFLRKILVEGWTTPVRTELLASDKSSRHPKHVKPRDGTYLIFSSDTQVNIYPELGPYDRSWVFSFERPLLGFLPSAHGPLGKDYCWGDYGLLLEKVDAGHYERVGHFSLFRCWKWDEQRRRWDVSTRNGGGGINATRQLFELG